MLDREEVVNGHQWIHHLISLALFVGLCGCRPVQGPQSRQWTRPSYGPRARPMGSGPGYPPVPPEYGPPYAYAQTPTRSGLSATPAAAPTAPAPPVPASPSTSSLPGLPVAASPPASAARAAPPAPKRTTMVTLILQRVIVSPHKPDGRAWDCCASISQADSRKVEDALVHFHTAAAQVVAVLSVLAPYAGRQTSAPDVAGNATLYAGGQAREMITFNKVGHKDDYAPTCVTDSGQNPTWSHVPLGPGTRLVGRLWDRDLTRSGADDIGPFEIDYQEIKAALAKRNIFTVRVPPPTSILFVQFSAVPE